MVMKNALLLIVVSVFLYFLVKKMSVWVNVHMSGWEFIALIIVVTGIGVYLVDRFKGIS